MSATPKRSRRKDARPAEILAAALTQFVEKGFGATRLDDIARAAGIAKGTLYLYFETKEDIFRAVVRQEILPRLAEIEAAISQFPGSSADLLRLAAARLQVAVDSQLGGIPKLVLTEAGNFPEIARFYADEVVVRAIRIFSNILQRGIGQGEFRPIAAETFLPLFVGPTLFMLLWRHSLGRHVAFDFDHAGVSATHINILLRGLAPEPTP